MTNKRTLALMTAGLVATGGSAHAVTGVISGESQLLTSILVQELMQVAKLADTVAQLRNMVGGINDLLATTRTAVRIARSIANFDPKTLLEDMKTVVLSEFPNAYGLYREIKDLEGNIDSLDDREAFWRRYTDADFRMDQLAEKTARFGIRASALNLLGPIVKEIDPDDTDRLVERVYHRSRVSLKRALRQSAWGQFVRRLKAHDTDARKRGNLPAQIDVVGASAAIEGANHAAELVDLKKVETAKAQAQREYQNRIDRTVQTGLRKGRLLRPAIAGPQ